MLVTASSVHRNAMSLKADWKVGHHSVFSLGHTIERSVAEVGTLLN